VRSVPCPLCRHGTPPAYTVRDFLYGEPGTFSFVCCAGCGHGFLHPMPTDQELAAMYARWYDARIGAAMKTVNDSRLVARFTRDRLADIESALGGRRARTILDIGCGPGQFLHALREALARHGPVEAIGIEPGRAAAEAQSRLASASDRHPPARVFLRPLDDEPVPADVVTMNHVLEHFPRPLDALRRAAASVRPGGVLSVEVPRGDSAFRRVLRSYWWLHLPPQHLHLFDRRGLTDAIGGTGLRVVSVRTGKLPAALTLGFVLFVRDTIGSASRFARLPPMRAVAWTLGLLGLPIALLLDATVGVVLNATSGGDVLRVTAVKDAVSP
jgi:2-polyprenyl-3-methyl-5-hydroxy-6-metoxy-1,4-benzoquinol methylase